jgi:hypothetical protein
MVVSNNLPNEVPVMSTELRFLKKLDGEQILQSRSYITHSGFPGWTEWEDIPMVEEIQVKDEVLITKPYEQATV